MLLLLLLLLPLLAKLSPRFAGLPSLKKNLSLLRP